MEWIKNAWSSILSLLPWIVAVMVIRIIAIKIIVIIAHNEISK